jgi:hypothetical protein
MIQLHSIIIQKWGLLLMVVIGKNTFQVFANLLVFHCPIDLIVVSCAQIDHDVLVAEEEHDGTRIVQLVHLVEV